MTSGHSELPHHAVVLMLQDVAVIHEGGGLDGLREAHQQIYRLADDDRFAQALVPLNRLLKKAGLDADSRTCSPLSWRRRRV